MKKLVLLLFVGTLFVLSPSGVSAQVQINVNINPMPQWGPAGYDRAEYYFLPEVGIYYYVPKAQFIYLQGGRWRFSNNLPYRYRDLNLFTTYKVVINKHKPYMQHNYYVLHYKKYRNSHSKQVTIWDSKGKRGKVGNRDVFEKPAMKNQRYIPGNKFGNKQKGNKGKQDKQGKQDGRR